MYSDSVTFLLTVSQLLGDWCAQRTTAWCTCTRREVSPGWPSVFYFASVLVWRFLSGTRAEINLPLNGFLLSSLYTDCGRVISVHDTNCRICLLPGYMKYDGIADVRLRQGGSSPMCCDRRVPLHALATCRPLQGILKVRIAAYWTLAAIVPVTPGTFLPLSAVEC